MPNSSSLPPSFGSAEAVFQAMNVYPVGHPKHNGIKWVNEVQTPQNDNSDRPFQFFAEFQTKKSPFERYVHMCIFMKDVIEKIESDALYNEFLQYVDPTDTELLEKIHESYEVYKNIKFPIPGELSYFPIWQCSLEPLMLTWADTNFKTHLVENYGNCNMSECGTCRTFHLMYNKCLGLSLIDGHHMVCNFRRFYTAMIKEHIVVCRNMTDCGLCYPIERTIFILNAANAMKHFDLSERAEKIITFMASDFRQGTHMPDLDDCLSNPLIIERVFTQEDILHLMYCTQPSCNYIHKCAFVRHALVGHPLKCWVPDGYNCVDCDLFNLICARHAAGCEEAKRPYELNLQFQTPQYNCKACEFILNQRRWRVMQMRCALDPGETPLSHFIARLKELSPELRAIGRYPHFPELDPPPTRRAIPQPIPKHLLKDYNFFFLYKDKHIAIGLSNPPELILCMDYSDKDPCHLCQMKHYCSLCQFRLLTQLQSRQKQLTDFVVNVADITLGELYKWSSVELIIKRCGERMTQNFEAFKKQVYPDKNFPSQFWELLFKINIQGSLNILQQRLEKSDYLPRAYTTNSKTKTKKLSTKSEKQKKKDLKTQQKKDGEIIYTVDGQCGKCSYYNTCEHCADLLHACCRDAVVMLKKVLKENNAYEDNEENREDGSKGFLEFVEIFRRIDQDQREMIGKRAAKLVEGLGDELLPVKFLDIFLNISKDPKRFCPIKAGRLWQELITCVQGRPVDYDAFFCHRRTKTDLSCIETRAPPRPPGVPRSMFNLEYTLSYNHESGHQVTNRLFYDGSPCIIDLEKNPRSIKEPCSKCPENTYCEDCKKKRLKFLKECRTMARRMIEIQTRFGVGQKCTKEYIVHQLNEEELSRVKALGEEWRRSQNPTDSGFDPWNCLEELSTFNWKAFNDICGEQITNLQAGKRIKYTDITGIVTAVSNKGEAPIQSTSTQLAIESAPGPSTSKTSPTTSKTTPRKRREQSGDYPKNRATQTHFIGNAKKKVVDPFPIVSPDGYEIQWIDGDPVIIITEQPQRSRAMMGEEEKILADMEDAVDLIKSAEHFYVCESRKNCALCRQYLLPIILHYRNCRKENCMQCKVAKKETLELYQHARYAKNLDFAYRLFLQAMEDSMSDTKRKKKKRIIEMKDDETQTQLCDLPAEWAHLVALAQSYTVLSPAGMELFPNLKTLEFDPPIRYICFIPENFRKEETCYRSLGVHPNHPDVKAYFAQHVLRCAAHYKETCTVCSLIVATYRYYNHLPLTCTLWKRFCYTCDAVLEAQLRHLGECVDVNCAYCMTLRNLLGHSDYTALLTSVHARKTLFAQCAIPTRIMHQRVGDAEGYSFVRLREEQEVVNNHTMWCLNPECEYCLLEKSMDDFLNHIDGCPNFFDENCEVCVNTGGNMAHHVLTCENLTCLFCPSVRRDTNFPLISMKMKNIMHAVTGKSIAKRYQPAETLDDPTDQDENTQLAYKLVFKALFENVFSCRGVTLPINPFGLRRSQYQLYDGHMAFALDADSWRYNAYNFRPARNKNSQTRLITKYIRLWKQDRLHYDPRMEPQFDAVYYHTYLMRFKWLPIERKRKMSIPLNFDWEPFRGIEAREMINHAENCCEQICTVCVKVNAFEEHSQNCQFDTPWSCELCVHFCHSRLEHLRSCGKCRYCQKIIKYWGKDSVNYLCSARMPDPYTLVFFLRYNADLSYDMANFLEG